MHPTRSPRGERGATSLVEMVIVAPVLLFALMMIIQGGLYFHARNVAEQAAQGGAAAARAYQGTAAAAENRTRDYLHALGPQTLRNRTVTASRGPDTARVAVSGTVLSLVPFVQFTVSESAAGPVERYEPPTDGVVGP